MFFLKQINIVKFGKNHKLVSELFLNSNIVISTIVSVKVKFRTSRSILNH
jgi:hypothetical protein